MAINDWYLNILQLPTISQESLDYLKTLEPYQAAQWEWKTKDMKAYKKELLEKLLYIQDNRCVYCGLGLTRRSVDREHFVHKAATRGYEQFMFNIDNLFAACEFCNRRLKGQKNVIGKYNEDYSKCTFTIIHPYYDVPSDYINFLPSNDKPYKAVPTDQDCGKGELTIKMFQLDSFEMAQERVGYIAQLELVKGPNAEIHQYRPKDL